ncbi:MAG: protein-tyrosine-phosphatase [Bacteroidota bacterium]
MGAALKSLIRQKTQEFELIPDLRKKTLKAAAAAVSDGLASQDHAKIMAICTHNSRRSQLMEGWMIAAAVHYGVEGLSAYSGGTEATAFNIRMVVAMRQAGFQLIEDESGKNPRYLLSPQEETVLPHTMFSKVYDDEFNPNTGFIALMVCDSADANCPYVPGAEHRFSIPYEDPKHMDDTPMEGQAYDDTINEIGREALYLMSLVQK